MERAALLCFNPSQENTAVLTPGHGDTMQAELQVSTPLRKTRPSSPVSVEYLSCDAVSFNPSQENTAVLTQSLGKWLLALPLFQPLSGKHGRPHWWPNNSAATGYNSFNPSQENTAVLTQIQTSCLVPNRMFQPLSGKHGRPHC